jgi:alpha-ketoglutaric semialdehyde dehydrogenase
MAHRTGPAPQIDAQPAPVIGRSLVAGEPAPTDASNGAVVFRAVDPTRGEELPTEFVSASAADVDRACWQAWQAFYAMNDRTGRDRAELLDQIARFITDRTELILATATDETGLGPARVVSECERTVATLRLFASIARDGEWVEPTIDLGSPSRRPVPKPDLRKILRPLGPVAVFGSAAFPLAFSTAGADTASALAAGCPVVLKGHAGHPGTGELVARCIADAVRVLGFHPGTFSFLHAGGSVEHAVGELLVKHTCIRAVGFTGSTAGGNAVMRLASQRVDPIPVFAQMGSTNPVFVLPEAAESQSDVIAERLVSAALAANGQMCTCPGLLFVARSSGSEAMLRAVAKAFNEALPQVMLNHRVRASFARRVAEVTALPGVDLRAGSPNAGHSSPKDIEAFRPGQTIRCSPVLLRTTFDVFGRTPGLHAEVFGPAMIAVVCDVEDQLVEAATAIQGSLTGAIWAASPDLPLARRIHAVLEHRVGRLVYNGMPVSLEVCPSIVHGGPHPATNQPAASAVGPGAIHRWCRPVCYQNCPDSLLPPELRNGNPLKLVRLVDGRPVRDKVHPGRATG